jgi:hypothetical protein
MGNHALIKLWQFFADPSKNCINRSNPAITLLCFEFECYDQIRIRRDSDPGHISSNSMLQRDPPTVEALMNQAFLTSVIRKVYRRTHDFFHMDHFEALDPIFSSVTRELPHGTQKIISEISGVPESILTVDPEWRPGNQRSSPKLRDQTLVHSTRMNGSPSAP